MDLSLQKLGWGLKHLARHNQKAFALILFLIFAGYSLAQQNDELAVLREKLEHIRTLHENEMRVLKERIEALEKAATNQTNIPEPPPAGQTTPVATTDAAQQTALDVYRETLPEQARRPGNELPAKLFDYLAKGFEWHGYFRSGYGINNKGGHMEAFQAPGAPAKYRLGNEQDTYIESAFVNKNWNPDPDGPDIMTQLRLAYKTQQNQSWNEQWNADNRVVLREMFAGMRNFIEANPSAKVWGGLRFYRLPQLNINDFWWYDMSGYGGGLEDMDLGFARLHIAYIGYSEDAASYWTSSDKSVYNYTTANGRLAKNNLNIAIADLDVGCGKLTFWINGGYMQGGATTNTNGQTYDYPAQAGVDCGLMHQLSQNNMANQLAVQYGYGCNSSLSSGANLPPTDENKRANIIRVTEMFDQRLTDRFSAEAVGVLQYMNNGAEHQADATWASLGIRPVYHFHKHIGIEFEPGFDYINDRKNKIAAHLFKLTGALRITPTPEFSRRPEFRIFCTYAQWGQDFEGNPALGGTAFLNQNEGFNFGVQAEHWW